MTMQELAQDALDVQNACNLSGVVKGMDRAMTALRELEPGNGTAFYNRHPIMVMWASKIANLTGSDLTDNLSEAMDQVEVLAKGQEPATV